MRCSVPFACLDSFDFDDFPHVVCVRPMYPDAAPSFALSVRRTQCMPVSAGEVYAASLARLRVPQAHPHVLGCAATWLFNVL